jgi:SAM-dependent methyltransferase
MKKKGPAWFILFPVFLLAVLSLQAHDGQTMRTSLGLTEARAEKATTREPDVHFVATPHEVVEIMLRLAEVRQTDVVYDLGCGDGRIVIAAAKKAGCKAYGFDLNPNLVEKSVRNVKKEKLEALVTIKRQDIFDLDLSQASVVTLYLLPELNVALIPQLDKMKPGSRIVSHNFDIEGVDPDVEATVHYERGKSAKIYLWTTPLKKPRPHFLRKIWSSR